VNQKLLRYADLVEGGIVNNRTTLSRWIEQHGFPKPIRLGPNSVAWAEEEVSKWLEARREETAA
jgi:prophage regulatory protein